MCHWIPSNECVKLQFLPTNPRDKVAKYFAGLLNTIKRAQRKDIRHDNTDMEHGNINAKHSWKFIVSTWNKDKMLLISCDEKCIVKEGKPGNPLALVPKSKTG